MATSDRPRHLATAREWPIFNMPRDSGIGTSRAVVPGNTAATTSTVSDKQTEDGVLSSTRVQQVNVSNVSRSSETSSHLMFYYRLDYWMQIRFDLNSRLSPTKLQLGSWTYACWLRLTMLPALTFHSNVAFRPDFHCTTCRALTMALVGNYGGVAAIVNSKLQISRY